MKVRKGGEKIGVVNLFNFYIVIFCTLKTAFEFLFVQRQFLYYNFLTITFFV